MQEVPLSELVPFKNHPFQVRDDEAMQKTVESIARSGVLSPAIVRPRQEGGYEIIAGHRRRRAGELAGLSTLPAIVRDLDDNMATILMVDSNIQREDVLPSEKAQAYKMKLEAIKRQGARTDRTSDQVGQKSKWSIDKIAEESGESKTQVQRYIRLTELSPQLQQMVDNKEIAMTPAVELSHLKPEEQQMIVDAIVQGQAIPTLSQAQQMKKISQSGGLDADALRPVMTEGKKMKQTAPSPTKQAEPPREVHPPFHPRDAPQEAAAIQEPEALPFQLGDKCYTTIQESVRDLKMDKDCSCTPDIFLAAITEFVKRFQSEISCYTGEYYEPIFPALLPVQLRYLRQQMDTICDAADQLYNSVERKNENE